MNLGRHKQQPEGAVQHYFFVLIHFWQRRRLHDPFPFNLLVANSHVTYPIFPYNFWVKARRKPRGKESARSIGLLGRSDVM